MNFHPNLQYFHHLNLFTNIHQILMIIFMKMVIISFIIDFHHFRIQIL